MAGDEKLSIVFVGFEEQGKSTLNGHLMLLTKSVSVSPEWETLFNEDPEMFKFFLRKFPRHHDDLWQIKKEYEWWKKQGEAESKTGDLYINEITGAPLSRKLVSIDVPGEDRYFTLWIKGLTVADVAIVVVSAAVFDDKARWKKVLAADQKLSFMLKTFHYQSVIFCINFMDHENVGWSRDRYESVKEEVTQLFSSQFTFKNQFFIPVSALKGDNLVSRSQNMPWYEGETLIELIQKCSYSIKQERLKLRVILSGTLSIMKNNKKIEVVNGIVESGTIQNNDMSLTIYPHKKNVKVSLFDFKDREIEQAGQGEYVSVLFSEPALDVDALHGSIIASDKEPPVVSNAIDALLFVLSDQVIVNKGYVFCLGETLVNCKLDKIEKSFGMIIINENGKTELVKEELIPAGIDRLEKNSISSVSIKLTTPAIAFDSYETNKNSSLCRFLLRDNTNSIIAIGLIYRGR